jgi:hypothetical protein
VRHGESFLGKKLFDIWVVCWFAGENCHDLRDREFKLLLFGRCLCDLDSIENSLQNRPVGENNVRLRHDQGMADLAWFQRMVDWTRDASQPKHGMEEFEVVDAVGQDDRPATLVDGSIVLSKSRRKTTGAVSELFDCEAAACQRVIGDEVVAGQRRASGGVEKFSEVEVLRG